MGQERGYFITLEGGEGAGKTTQARLLREWLDQKQIAVHVTREPGGTGGAEALRSLLIQGDDYGWDATTELLLFLAARRDHVKKVIQPKIDSGIWVLCDRFQDSTTAYQGWARGLGVEYAEQLYRMTIGNFAPDLTLWLDLPVEQGLTRAKGAVDHVDGDRFENEALAFHHALQEGFGVLAKRNGQRIRHIDASGTPELVHQRVTEAVQAALPVTRVMRDAA